MPKKTPLRMCLGCREMKPKSELIRIVRSPENEISLDPTGKKPGRGAYVCKKTECLKRTEKAKALSRAFNTMITEDIINRLQEQIEN